MITDWFACDQVAVPAAAASAEPPKPAWFCCGCERDGEVGADVGERVERLLLGAAEAAREAGEGDHERDADAEPEERHDRARATAEQLVAEVPQVEHDQTKPAKRE